MGHIRLSRVVTTRPLGHSYQLVAPSVMLDETLLRGESNMISACELQG